MDHHVGNPQLEKQKHGRWKMEEHDFFLLILSEQQCKLNNGRVNFRYISSILGTRSPMQVKSHYQKYNIGQLKKEQVKKEEKKMKRKMKCNEIGQPEQESEESS